MIYNKVLKNKRLKGFFNGNVREIYRCKTQFLGTTHDSETHKTISRELILLNLAHFGPMFHLRGPSHGTID